MVLTVPLNVNVQDGPRELRAAVLAMKRADKDVRDAISNDLRGVMGPAWASLLPQFATGLPIEKTLLVGVRIAAGNPPQLIAANSRRKIGRGLIPTEHWPLAEYGTGQPQAFTTYDRKNRAAGGTHKVRRRTRTGLPAYRKGGRVIGPAVARFLPRVCAFWVQSVVRAFMDAADRKV